MHGKMSLKTEAILQIKKNKNNDSLFISSHTVSNYSKKLDEVNALVEKADKDILRKFLVPILMKDDSLLFQLNKVINKNKIDITQYYKQIDLICNRHTDRHGYVDYFATYDFANELESIMHNDIHPMIDNEQCKNAFDILCYIHTSLEKTDADDSDGYIGEVSCQICEMWKKLISYSIDEEKDSMFKWFMKRLRFRHITVFDQYIEEIVMDCFYESRYAEQILNAISLWLDSVCETGYSDFDGYYINKWARYYICILADENREQAEIDAFCNKYWSINAVKDYCTEKFIENKKYDRALSVLAERLNNAQSISEIRNFTEKKKDIYLLLGNTDEYKNQLTDLFIKYSNGDLAYFKELKTQYSTTEWPAIRDALFAELSNDAHWDKLYFEEEMYDKLIEYAEQKYGLYTIDKYKKVLVNLYPERVLQKYIQVAEDMAESTGTRNHYREIVDILRGIKKIKGGTKAANDLVEQWRIKYKNRRAMLEELSKL